MNAGRAGLITLAGWVALAATACDDGTTALEEETALLSVAPGGGQTDVALDAPVVVTFDHPMHDHSTGYMAVHEGDVRGPVVQGAWVMEENGTRMRFVADHGWRPGAEYTIHIGGGMTDAAGHHVDLEHHGMDMGGTWAEGSMMGGGMMGDDHPHMGEGWQHENGGYGMLFTFGTAGTPTSSLVAVEPRGGETSVDPAAPVVVTFDQPLDPAMVEFAALHEGDVNGPEVAGTWSLSQDGLRLTFTQDAPLESGTTYTIHLGGGMMDTEGHSVDMAHHGTEMGGDWATGGMMSGGMHGGQHTHMGEGWDHPENGSHGMFFSFTTAS